MTAYMKPKERKEKSKEKKWVEHGEKGAKGNGRQGEHRKKKHRTLVKGGDRYPMQES